MPQDPKSKWEKYSVKWDKYAVQEQAEPTFSDRAKQVFTQPASQMSKGMGQILSPKYQTSPLAGAMNVGAGATQMAGWPIGLAAEGVKSMPPWMRAIPGLTFAPEAVSGVEGALGAVGEFFGGHAENAADFLLQNLPENQRREFTDPARDIGSLLGQTAVTAGVGKGLSPKSVGGAFRAVGPSPEAVYSKGGGLGALNPLDRAAATRGVRERITLGGKYENLPKQFEKIQTDKSVIFEKQINPEVQKMTDAGLSRSTAEIADRAVADLQKRFPDLKAPDAARYAAELEKLKQGFIEGNPETLSPKQMQEMKTAVHQRAPMDEMSGLRNEFNKTVAFELRKSLEGWNPRLKPLHRRWAELNRLSQSMEEIGQREGRSSSSPLSSAPFYMAVGDPVRGAILAEARNIAKSPRIRSKAAFMLDFLQHIGNPRTPEVLPPPFNIAPADITKQ